MPQTKVLSLHTTWEAYVRYIGRPVSSDRLYQEKHLKAEIHSPKGNESVKLSEIETLHYGPF